MKILITSQGPSLDSPWEPRFGRAPYFIVVDPDTMEYQAIQNPNANAPGGAGIASARMAQEFGVSCLITGRVGPNAYPLLESAGIKILTGTFTTVKDAIEKFKKGDINEMEGGDGMPFYRGFGGSFFGGGFGPAPGRGWRMWGGYPPYSPFPGYPDPQLELEMLKAQAEILRRHLQEIEKRIKELEGK